MFLKDFSSVLEWVKRGIVWKIVVLSLSGPLIQCCTKHTGYFRPSEYNFSKLDIES